MASVAPPAPTDRDLTSIQEARRLAERARAAAPALAELTQDQIDAIVDAMAAAVRPLSEELAKMAVEETGFGVVADKIQKNAFASERVYEFIRPMKTVGVISRDETKKVVEIAEPFGVVAAIVPSTNPTSTAIYKILIAIKARCPIVLSPHPSAARCITRVAEVMAAAAAKAGAPAGAINWMQTVSLEGTQELMKHRAVAVILATGGMGLVRAAYSAGKPAYGVGPGNAPCYVDRTADPAKAALDIITGKSFDNGLLCSSPNSVVVDASVADEVRRQFKSAGAHFLSPDEAGRLAATLVTPRRLPNPEMVGRSAVAIAKQVGLSVPDSTRVLVAELEGVGRDHPLSIEKLCPVLSWYTVADWRAGCQRCIEILRYGGMGHTMSIHSQDEDVILQFGLKKPAFRIVVNTPTTHGSIGLSTGLDPAMTLGCGGYGGNITSDNISPRHLLNLKRLAYEIRPVTRPGTTGTAAGAAPAQGRPSTPGGAPPARSPLPKAPAATTAPGLSASAVQAQVASMLGQAPEATTPPTARPAAADFVCEEDVREAIRDGRTIMITERTIVTPAARDLAAPHRVLVEQTWRTA